MKITVERADKTQPRLRDVEAANAAASDTATYYNGGVEGPAFAHWYQTVLAPKMGILPPTPHQPGTAPKAKAKASVVRVERRQT
ncbi:hypothetical protein ACEN2J_07245 [Pseudorhodobacter sp. W20_MBD10_FR17]|uniref:hypothetical protein n=1 Tax=Pseudorhodobacter sp. W20_MBD10_FR17 TaxID=3240266 RepID=UPI003F96F480